MTVGQDNPLAGSVGDVAHLSAAVGPEPHKHGLRAERERSMSLRPHFGPRGRRPSGAGTPNRRSRAASKIAMVTIAVVAVTVGVAARASASGPWSAQTSGTIDPLSGVSFIDADHGWAVGGNGVIVATADAGVTWTAETSNTNSTLHGVTFIDASHGWAVGEFGAIVATADGGATWTTQDSGSTSQEYVEVAFADINHGWVVGFGGTILATADGGATWTAQNSGTTTQTLFGVSFVNATHGWVVGTFGTILTTTDGGGTWNSQTSGTNALNSVSFADAHHGWAVGDNGTVLVTADAGVTWNAQSSGTTNRMFGVAFADVDHGWAVGDGGTIIATADGGTTWAGESSGTNTFLLGVSFPDANHGWLVGGNGTIEAFVNSPPAGQMATTPSSGAPGAVISVDSVTSCPKGSTRAAISFKNSADATVATAAASSFDASGNWAGTVSVPAAAAPGSYFVTATCFQPSTIGSTDTQNYNFVPFTVVSVPPPTGTLKGRTFNLNGAQLARVAVALDSGSPRVTRSSGGYAFTGVSAGPHTLSATFKGHACHAGSRTGPTAPITAVVSGGGSTTVNWYCSTT